MSRFQCLLSVFVVFCATSLLQAQPPGGGQDRGRRRGGSGMMSRMMSGPGGSLVLLRSEQIQKELEIVDEQKEKLKKLGEDARKEMEEAGKAMREKFAGMRDLSDEERRAKFEAMRTDGTFDDMRKKMEGRAEEMMKKVEGILLPHQLSRLSQIQLQTQGGGSSITSNPKVVEKLKLTEKQKEELRKIRDEYNKKREGARGQYSGLRELDEEARNAKLKEIRDGSTKLRKETEEKALAVLTGEQRATLEKMVGKKFEFDRSQMWGRGGRGGGRPGGEGGGRPGGESSGRPK